MKLFSLFLVLFSLSLFAENADLLHTDQYIQCEFNFDSLTVKNVQKNSTVFTKIQLNNLSTNMAPGMPQLPVAGLTLAVPPNSNPSIQILEKNTVLKTFGSIPVNEDSSVNINQSSWLPEKSIEITASGYIRDQQIVQIRISPIRYHPLSKQCEWTKHLTVRVLFNSTLPGVYRQSAEHPVAEKMLQHLLDNYDNGKKWRYSNPSLAKSQALPLGQARIHVRQEGVYKVSGQDLLNVGIALEDIQPNLLDLSCRNIPVPFEIQGIADGRFDPDDKIVFIGTPAKGDNSKKSFYSDDNVYMLRWGQKAGSRFLPIDKDFTETDQVRSSAWSIVYREFDDTYQRLVSFDDETADHWFWINLTETSSFTYPILLPDIFSGGHYRVRAGLHGLTENESVEKNHHLLVLMDDVQVAEAYGSQARPFELHSPTIAFSNTEMAHDITFAMSADHPQVDYDHAFFNWFQIEYERILNLHDGVLDFQYDPILNGIYEIANASQEKYYILTENGHVIRQPHVIEQNDKFFLHFALNERDKDKIYIAKSSALLNPILIEPSPITALASAYNAADYIIITHENFQDQAVQLAAHRQRQGLRTKVVDIFSIYDEFNDGLYDPRAIHSFLKTAYANWQRPAPLYVLLLGDTSYLMKKNVVDKESSPKYNKSYVPSMMLYTRAFGMTSSDNYFSAVSGDDELPDLFIGRLPANSAAQAQDMVDKIISYDEQKKTEEWRRRIALVAGNGTFFKESSQYLVDNIIPKSYPSQQISTEPESPYFTTTQDFIDSINEGHLVINFLVHGSGNQISDARLLTKDDIIRLENKDRYAFSATMSCYIGHFDNPKETSLGEALLLEAEKGVIALYGSAGQAYQYADFHLTNALFEGIYKQGLNSIGAMTTFSKFGLIDKVGGYWDAVRNFVLLGDPATSLHVPNDTIELNSPKNVYFMGDEMSVSGSLPDNGDGEVLLNVVNEMDSVLYSTTVMADNGRFSSELFTMDEQKRALWNQDGGYGWIRAFYANALTSFVGSYAFGVGKALVDSVGTLPEQPTGFEPFTFQITFQENIAQSLGGIDSVQTLWSLDQQNWNVLPMQLNNGSFRTTDSLSFEVGTYIYFKFNIFSIKGKNTTSVYMQKVYFYPDLVFIPGLTAAGSSEPLLKIPIKNQSESSAENVLVVVQNASQSQELGRSVVQNIPAHADTLVDVILSAVEPGMNHFNIGIDPENTIQEEEENNNTLSATLAILTEQQGGAMPIPFLRESVTLTVEPQVVNGYSSCDVQFYENINAIELAKNSSLTPIYDEYFKTTLFYQLQLSDSTQLLKPVHASVQPITGQQLDEKLAIYTFDSVKNCWIAQPSTFSSNDTTLSASLPAGTRFFAPMICDDTAPPNIVIDLDGQHFVDGDWVPKNPVFIISLSDSSGILFDDSFQFRIDDLAVPPEDYTLRLHPEHNRSAVLTWAPQLEGESHQLYLEICDVNMNKSQIKADFNLSQEFGLDFLANHPNPFYDETVFAFQLQDVAEKVQIDIYTVSGRMIQSFTLYDVSGYIEVEWDGRDKDGRDIANGVYYCRFVAKQDEKRIERIEKIAKLQ